MTPIRGKQIPSKVEVKPPQAFLLDTDPQIVIERVGKYWFKVYIRENWLISGPMWYRLGYERAYKKGRKELKKFKKQLKYKKEIVVINEN